MTAAELPTADREAAAEFAALVGPAGDLDATKARFRVLWLTILGQWGPKPGARGRRQHCWRLSILLDEMRNVAEPWNGDHLKDEDVSLDWLEFLTSLPGFNSYWACSCAWLQHGAPR